MCIVEGCENIPKPKRKQCQNCSTLKHKYGITTPERNRLLEEQGGECAICSSPIAFNGQSGIQKHVANLDHCHATGKVRGVLCGHCNSALGLFYDRTDFLHSAITYLEAE